MVAPPWLRVPGRSARSKRASGRRQSLCYTFPNSTSCHPGGRREVSTACHVGIILSVAGAFNPPPRRFRLPRCQEYGGGSSACRQLPDPVLAIQREPGKGPGGASGGF